MMHGSGSTCDGSTGSDSAGVAGLRSFDLIHFLGVWFRGFDGAEVLGWVAAGGGDVVAIKLNGLGASGRPRSFVYPRRRAPDRAVSIVFPGLGAIVWGVAATATLRGPALLNWRLHQSGVVLDDLNRRVHSEPSVNEYDQSEAMSATL